MAPSGGNSSQAALAALGHIANKGAMHQSQTAPSQIDPSSDGEGAIPAGATRAAATPFATEAAGAAVTTRGPGGSW